MKISSSWGKVQFCPLHHLPPVTTREILKHGTLVRGGGQNLEYFIIFHLSSKISFLNIFVFLHQTLAGLCES